MSNAKNAVNGNQNTLKNAPSPVMEQALSPVTSEGLQVANLIELPAFPPSKEVTQLLRLSAQMIAAKASNDGQKIQAAKDKAASIVGEATEQNWQASVTRREYAKKFVAERGHELWG